MIALSACESAVDRELRVRALDFQSMTDRVTAQSVTASMPVSGTATFLGHGAIITSIPGDELIVIGQASLNADFLNGTVSGDVTNFLGGDNVSTDAFTGSIAITNGVIGNSGAASVEADFAGTLTGAGHTMVTSGTLFGDFVGTNAGAILLATDTETTTVDGLSETSVFAIVAED